MEPVEERFTDKTAWGPGPWQDEPDRIEWRHSSGLPCLIVRSDSTGALCGYVGVPPGHPLHGKGWSEVDLNAHGGVNYSESCDEGGLICHVPQPGEESNVWWLGFDCGHAFDYMPLMSAQLSAIHRENGSLPFASELLPADGYKHVAYVRAEVEQLADQLVDARDES